jgi:hypothetical protein
MPPEELTNVIREIHARLEGFNPPATENELSRLCDTLGFIPEEISLIYRDHNGSADLPRCGMAQLTARLMPIDEVLDTKRAMVPFAKSLASVGSVTWFWTDDNSNYCGIYTDGPLTGWLTCLNHDEPMLTPAFRSVAAFLKRLLDSATGIEARSATCDLPTVPREIPALADDPRWIEQDRRLVSLFRELYAREDDEHLRRLHAFCAICLTPVADTEQVLSFFLDNDMWTPEAAVSLLEIRKYRGGVSELEKLATTGFANGDSAAMRQLVRMNSNQAREALARLKQTLTGRKLQTLESWLDRRGRLLPPHW